MTTEQSGNLLDEVYPYALDGISEMDRRRIDRMRSAADPEVAARFDATVAHVRETLADLTVVDSLAPPAGLEARVLAALDRAVAAAADDPRRISRPARLRWLAAAAAIVVAAGAGIGTVVYRHSDSPPSSALATVQMIDRQPDAVTPTARMAIGGTVVVHMSTSLSLLTVGFE
ncbi:RskA family anti-sigma factor, partial [Nocardia gipuzkoensis]